MNGDTLTAEQVNSAMAMIMSNWGNQSMTDSVRDTWRRKLASLRQGEFQPAFDAWLDGPRCRFRPDVGEFMDLVLARRPRPVLTSDINAPKRDDPNPHVDDWVAGYGDDVPSTGEEWLDEYKRIVRGP